MTEFIDTANTQLGNEFESLADSRSKFVYTMKFYQFRPRSGTLADCQPQDFFVLWSSFCIDFKDIWKKEIDSIMLKR